MIVLKPTNNPFKVFLAGSIEQGKAEQWQEEIVKGFENSEIIFYNPRNDIWKVLEDEESQDNAEKRQINWELSLLESADLIVMYLDPNTKSCISLLELGLYARSNKLVVATLPSFWRYNNVEVTCKKYNIPLLPNIMALQNIIRSEYEKHIN